MKRFLPLFLLFGCSGSEGAGEQANRQVAAPATKRGADPAPAGGRQSLSLTGLYEAGSGSQKSQLCILEKGATAKFGLVVWGSNQHSCSGIGSATRRAGAVRLAMAGDETCTLDAAVSGGTITLPAVMPKGCAYYCGARATLTNVAFAQTGTTKADALRAKDLVGESLCADM